MTLHRRSSLSLLIALLLSLPLTCLAEETVLTTPNTPATVPSVEVPPQTPLVTVTVQQVFKELLKGEQPRSPVILRDRLDQYTVTVQNNQPNPVQIIAGELPNHLPPEQAYKKAKQSTGVAYASALGLGLALAPFTFGATLVAEAFIGGPLGVFIISSKNKKLLNYVNQYPGTVPFITLLPHESKTFTFLIDKDVKPEVHLSVQDLKTQTVFNYP